MSLVQAATTRSLSFAQTRAQGFAEAAMNSTVSITRPASATYDQGLRQYAEPVMSAVYDGKAGITIAAGPITYSVGDEPTYYSSITVYIPHNPDVLPRVDDVIVVVSGPDADLDGRYFRVNDVPVGGRVSTSIQLSATGIAPSRQWS